MFWMPMRCFSKKATSCSLKSQAVRQQTALKHAGDDQVPRNGAAVVVLPDEVGRRLPHARATNATAPLIKADALLVPTPVAAPRLDLKVAAEEDELAQKIG